MELIHEGVEILNGLLCYPPDELNLEKKNKKNEREALVGDRSY